MPKRLNTSSLKIGDSRARDAKTQKIIDNLQKYYSLGKRANSPKNTLSTKEFAEKCRLGEITMRKARAFAREYTENELAKLCALRRPNGLPLQWGYIPYLLTVADKRHRKELQQTVAREGWSPAELHAEIRLKQGGHVSRGGRPVKRPGSAKACFVQIITECRPWIRRFQEMRKSLGTRRPRPDQRLAREATKVLRDLAGHAQSLSKQIEK
jgi:hypothetical protein